MKRIGKNETTEMAPVKKCFVALEAALYLLFLALDAFSTGGDGVKYLTIVVCLLAAVWSARHGGSRLMAWAMAFTLAADTFLLLLDRWYGAGIALFCVVQGLYLVRIRRAPYNQITRLNTLQAFGAVLPSCLPTLQQDDRMLDILCDALSHMLSAVPVYTLDCLPNADAARVSSEALFGDARQ